MLQNHEAGLNYIKNDKKRHVSLPNDAISHKYMHNTENTITPETDIQRLADMHGEFA